MLRSSLFVSACLLAAPRAAAQPQDFTSCAPLVSDTCVPGVGGIGPCPCLNPQVPALSVKGCDNSSATGGANLSSTGAASIGSDTLVFTCTGEKPTAASILMQGTVFLPPPGVIFGQGVRCCGGNLKRLYVHSAVGGTVSFGHLIGSDMDVHLKSAALGDPLAACVRRCYQVYYRDPIVLGGCPASATFNISQAQDVTWGR